MTTAWADFHLTNGQMKYASHQLRDVFAQCLRNAWIKVKNAARMAARSIDDLKAEIEHLRNKTRLDWQGQERITALQSAVRAAKAREAEVANEAKRTLIASAAV